MGFTPAPPPVTPVHKGSQGCPKGSKNMGKATWPISSHVHITTLQGTQPGLSPPQQAAQEHCELEPEHIEAWSSGGAPEAPSAEGGWWRKGRGGEEAPCGAHHSPLPTPATRARTDTVGGAGVCPYDVLSIQLPPEWKTLNLCTWMLRRAEGEKGPRGRPQASRCPAQLHRRDQRARWDVRTKSQWLTVAE